MFSLQWIGINLAEWLDLHVVVKICALVGWYDCGMATRLFTVLYMKVKSAWDLRFSREGHFRLLIRADTLSGCLGL